MSLQVKTTQFIGKELHSYVETTSTNETAKQLIANNKPSHGAVILADYQTKGRGQSGNSWQSAPRKNLLLTLILQPKNLQVQQQFLFNMLISIAIAECIQTFVNKTVQVKWPNDVLIDGHKLAGILIENNLQGNKIAQLLVGMGINVNQIHFNSDLSKTTSLKLETGVEISRQAVLESLLTIIEHWIGLFNQDRFSTIKRTYLSQLYQYQEEKEYLINGKRETGEIIGVNETGKLVVNVQGKLLSFANKEIEFL